MNSRSLCVEGGKAEEMEIEGTGGAGKAEDLVVVGVSAQQILQSNDKKWFDEDDKDFEEQFKGFWLLKISSSRVEQGGVINGFCIPVDISQVAWRG